MKQLVFISVLSAANDISTLLVFRALFPHEQDERGGFMCVADLSIISLGVFAFIQGVQGILETI